MDLENVSLNCGFATQKRIVPMVQMRMHVKILVQPANSGARAVPASPVVGNVTEKWIAWMAVTNTKAAVSTCTSYLERQWS